MLCLNEELQPLITLPRLQIDVLLLLQRYCQNNKIRVRRFAFATVRLHVVDECCCSRRTLVAAERIGGAAAAAAARRGRGSSSALRAAR